MSTYFYFDGPAPDAGLEDDLRIVAAVTVRLAISSLQAVSGHTRSAACSCSRARLARREAMYAAVVITVVKIRRGHQGSEIASWAVQDAS